MDFLIIVGYLFTVCIGKLGCLFFSNSRFHLVGAVLKSHKMKYGKFSRDGAGCRGLWLKDVWYVISPILKCCENLVWTWFWKGFTLLY